MSEASAQQPSEGSARQAGSAPMAKAYQPAEVEPSETAEARIKRFLALTKSQPEHPESRMLMAELYIAAEDFPAARKAMGDLANETPTARSLTIMAAIERGEGASDTVVKGWLARALNAPRGPQWVCWVCDRLGSSKSKP